MQKQEDVFFKVHLALQVDFYFLESARTHHQGNSANISQNLAPKAWPWAAWSPPGQGRSSIPPAHRSCQDAEMPEMTINANCLI